MNPAGAVTLSDHRLVLGCPGDDLVAEIVAACQDPALHRWLSVLPDPYTQADGVAFVRHCAEHWALGTQNVFAITASGDGHLLGMVALHDIVDLTAPGGGMADVGFWAVAAERGQGIVPDALRLVCEYGFTVLGLARIQWQAQVGNTASLQVARKVGFVFEGTCRRRLLVADARVDCWLAGLLPEDLRRGDVR